MSPRQSVRPKHAGCRPPGLTFAISIAWLTGLGGYPLAYAIHGGVAAIALAIFIYGRRSIAPEDDRQTASPAVLQAVTTQSV